jgi:hypothetical protein
MSAADATYLPPSVAKPSHVSAYAGLTAPQLLALLIEKRKENDEIIAALMAVMGGRKTKAKAVRKTKVAAPAAAAAAAATGAGAGAGAPAAPAGRKTKAAVPPIYVGKFVDKGDELSSYDIYRNQAKFDRLSAEEKSHFCTLTSLGISDAEQNAWHALYAREEEMAEEEEEEEELEEKLDKVYSRIVAALRHKASSA